MHPRILEAGFMNHHVAHAMPDSITHELVVLRRWCLIYRRSPEEFVRRHGARFEERHAASPERSHTAREAEAPKDSAEGGPSGSTSSVYS